ncbi:Cap-specific mRNA (nucleoside-2'-O-)-methyltransferase 1 [Porites harrisoni]
MSNTRKRKHDGLTQDGKTRIKVERSLSSSDSDEELSSPSYASFLHGDRKPVYSDVVWKQMEKMGYKAGESLGKTGLGNKHFSVTKNQGNDSEDEVLNNASQPESVYSDFAQRQMESMGFQQGGGLGRFGQGRADIIEASQQRGGVVLASELKALMIKIFLGKKKKRL